MTEDVREANPQSEIPNPQSDTPSLRGRPRALDENKKATVCSLVAAGVSLRQAARFVDCDRSSIRREARRNAAFRRQLAKARSEASIHPLQTLRQAARTNWRAALCWMERLDPQRFARPDASVVTQRESNQFVVNLVESIEQAVSDPSERGDLFELLSAVMPAAMRRRWDGRRLRGKVKPTKIAEERTRRLERPERDGRSRAGSPNIAPPANNSAPPPERNSDDFAPPEHANRDLANDLPQPGGAKLPI